MRHSNLPQLPLPLQMRSQMVLTPEDEQVLWWVLHRHATAPVAADGGSEAGSTIENGGGSGGGGGNSEPSLNYDEFVQASWSAVHELNRMLSAAAALGSAPCPIQESTRHLHITSGVFETSPTLPAQPQVATECREAFGPAADAYFQVSDLAWMLRAGCACSDPGLAATLG